MIARLRPSPATSLGFAAVVAVLVVWRVLLAGQGVWLDGQVSVDPLLDEVTREPGPADRALRMQIARRPTEAETFADLAMELEKQGQSAQAQAAFAQALRLDPTHPRVQLEAARHYLRHDEIARAMPILRQRMDLDPDRAADVWPIFLAELESGRGTVYLRVLGRERLAWFPAFVRHACEKASAVGPVVGLFAARAEAGTVTDDERNCVVGRLQREGRWADARKLWLASLPPDAAAVGGTPFNGGFERALSNQGFDWIAPPQESARVDVAPGPAAGDTSALQVTYVHRRYAGPPVYQYLMLAPGRHALSGRGRSDAFESWLGVQWGLYCVPVAGAEPRQLARTEPFVGTAGWAAFRREFLVPPDCAVQILRLELANPNADAMAPGSVEARLRGTLWFDDFKIEALN